MEEQLISGIFAQGFSSARLERNLTHQFFFSILGVLLGDFRPGSSAAFVLSRYVVRSWKDLRSRNIVGRIGSEERPDMGRQSRKAE